MAPGILAAVVYIVVPASSIDTGCIVGIVVLMALTVAAYITATTQFDTQQFIES